MVKVPRNPIAEVGKMVNMMTAPFAAFRMDAAIPELHGCAGFACVEKYVGLPDEVYNWTLTGPPQKNTSRGVPWTTYTVKLHSLAWLPRLTGRPFWAHTLSIVVPDGVESGGKQAGWAGLYVDERPWLAQEMAARTGIISVSVAPVPNVGIDLVNDMEGPIHEEKLKAIGWLEYSKHPDHPEWPIEMPNVKSVVRAMDCVQEFVRSQGGAMPPVDRFIVSGHSKRAVATYMAGAVDKRVAAIMPLGHAMNLNAQGRDSFRNIGQVVLAADIYDMVGTQHIVGRPLERLEGIIDPYSYVGRLTMPKLLMLCGGDDFFAPDCTRTWWSETPGTNLLYVFGNCPHESYQRREDPVNRVADLGGMLPDFQDAADAFVNALVLGEPMPRITTDFGRDGAITASQDSPHEPTQVSLHLAHAAVPGTRDFRRAAFTKSRLPMSPAPGTKRREWKAHPPPDLRYVAFYLEFRYPPPRPGAAEWRLTTEVAVLPQLRPFKLAPGHVRANYLYR